MNTMLKLLFMFALSSLSYLSAETPNWLAHLNRYRAMHSAQPLVISQVLTQSAQKVADANAAIGRLEHSKGNYGENLAYTGYPDGNVTLAIDLFYSEVDVYDWKNPGYSDRTGHFTQLVWNSSSSVGVGTNGHFICMQFYPPGNYLGSFEYNVFPLAQIVPIPVVPSPIPVVPSPSPLVPSPIPVVPSPILVVPSPIPVVPSPSPIVPSPSPIVPSPSPIVPSPIPVIPSPSPIVPSEINRTFYIIVGYPIQSPQFSCQLPKLKVLKCSQTNISSTKIFYIVFFDAESMSSQDLKILVQAMTLETTFPLSTTITLWNDTRVVLRVRQNVK
jgi:hypothetical protein